MWVAILSTVAALIVIAIVITYGVMRFSGKKGDVE